jgi:hypothetical protein
METNFTRQLVEDFNNGTLRKPNQDTVIWLFRMIHDKEDGTQVPMYFKGFQRNNVVEKIIEIHELEWNLRTNSR